MKRGINTFPARAAGFLILFLCATLLISSALANTIIGDGYYDGLIRYRTDKGKIGYMDMEGNIVIKAGKFLNAWDFHNGRAQVQVSSGNMARWQYIDTTGKVVTKSIDTKDKHYGFREWQGDYALVEVWSISRKKGLTISECGVNYINAKGKLISKEDFLYGSLFQEGYALVGTGTLPYKNPSFTSSGYTLSVGGWSGNNFVNAANQFFFIDMEGNRLGNLVWDQARQFFNGYAAVAMKTAGDSYLWGFINNQGEMTVSPQWAEVGNFYQGLAWVFDGEKYGYINEAGDVVIPCQYDKAAPFTGPGLAAVKVGYDWGFINMQGEMVIEPAYSSAGSFEGSFAKVENGVGWGIINEAGEWVISPMYESIKLIGKTGLYSATEWSKPMIVSDKGEIVTILLVNGEVPTDEQLAQYPEGMVCKVLSTQMENGITLNMFFDDNANQISMNVFGQLEGSEFRVRYGSGNTYILNAQGQRITEEPFQLTSFSNEHCIAVMKNNLYGYIDLQGNYLRRPQYSKVSSFNSGMATVYIGNNASLIDDRARDLLPTIQKKSSKDDIKRLQQALIDQGFLKGKANGSFNKNLTEAVKAAQKAFGMEPTGVADSAFQYELFK